MTTKLQEAICVALKKGQEHGKNNLSKFEILKLMYLIETESRKYAGISLFGSDVEFIRHVNGPISIQVFEAINDLVDHGIVQRWEAENIEYGHARHCHKLVRDDVDISQLTDGESVFIDSVLEDYIGLNISSLKSVVYQTEPMSRIQNEEAEVGHTLLNRKVDLNSIALDPDVAEAIAQ